VGSRQCRSRRGLVVERVSERVGGPSLPGGKVFAFGASSAPSRGRRSSRGDTRPDLLGQGLAASKQGQDVLVGDSCCIPDDLPLRHCRLDEADGSIKTNRGRGASPLQQLRPQAMTRAFGWVLRSVLDVASFTIFSMALALSSLVIVPLLAAAACTPKGHRHLGHPMAWTNDHDSHLAIREVVRARLKAVQCDRQVRVGHSQGGSILAELLPPGRSSDRPWTVTLGSGHALLVALNEGRRDTRTVAVLLLGMLLFMMAGGVRIRRASLAACTRSIDSRHARRHAGARNRALDVSVRSAVEPRAPAAVHVDMARPFAALVTHPWVISGLGGWVCGRRG
jgi:hypothetical protein